MSLRIEDLDAETLDKLGVGDLVPATAKPRSAKQKFTVEDERRNAINVLAVISKLSQSQRRKVLRRAMELNNV